jgi:hypothetical protein
MMTIETFSMSDVDRILGLADQTLEDWAEDAVQAGNRDLEYEERAAEWKTVRPLLVAAPVLFQALQTICAPRGPAPLTLDACVVIAQTAIATMHEAKLGDQSPVAETSSK